MNIEPVSGNMFTVELDKTEFRHLLELSKDEPSRMLEVLILWFEIGYLTSRNLIERIDRLCELNKLTNANSF